jgi:Asp-tRNA(Asn)/Glu-tRNA(Gln) amidotransferase C subunit
MTITKETLQAMIREFQGIELSDDELEIIAPALEGYLAEVENLRELDLSKVMSGRVLRAQEGGKP